MDRTAELLRTVKNIETYLLLSRDFRAWLQKRSPKEKALWSDKILEIMTYRMQLENKQLTVLADAFDKLAPELKTGTAALKEELTKLEKFIHAIDTLSKVVGVIAKAVKVL
jgi:hypothetical protein